MFARTVGFFLESKMSDKKVKTYAVRLYAERAAVVDGIVSEYGCNASDSLRILIDTVQSGCFGTGKD